MKTTEKILRKHIPNCIWGDEGGTSFMLDTVPASLILNAMEEYKKLYIDNVNAIISQHKASIIADPDDDVANSIGCALHYLEVDINKLT